MLNALARLLAAIGLLAAPVLAAAQELDPEGRWALHADGRIIAVLQLRRETGGELAGQWIRPERMTIDNMHSVSDVGGPVAPRPIIAAVRNGEALELTVRGRSDEQPPTVFTFRVLQRDYAELGYRDWPAMPPLPLARAPAEAAISANWEPGRRYPITTPRPSNDEMRAIFEADQADRQSGLVRADPAEVVRRDSARRERTRELLEAGALQSGEDYWHAAFVFQHGDGPGDYLLAHSFAVLAAARGRSDAAWIAAATLDRYLQSIGRGQIYGTQLVAGGSGPAEPFDRSVVPDSLRQELGVPPLAGQQRQPGGERGSSPRP